jgi:hypothetical protein
MKDEWPWTSEHYISLVEADLDYLPTDSGEGEFPKKSAWELERIEELKKDWARGISWERAYYQMLANEK